MGEPRRRWTVKRVCEAFGLMEYVERVPPSPDYPCEVCHKKDMRALVRIAGMLWGVCGAKCAAELCRMKARDV